MESIRSSTWKKIWDKKFEFSQDKALHVLDGFDSLSQNQWARLVKKFLDLIEIMPDGEVLEVGCGTGAFIEHIGQCKSLSGVDYSENAIEQVKVKLRGDFRVAEAAVLPFHDKTFDVVICFSVFFYFDSLNYATRVLKEMCRVLKPNGIIFIGDVNDATKEGLYNRIRENEGRDDRKVVKNALVTQLFYDKQFFVDFASENNLEITIVDEERMEIPYYSCALYRFSVIMRDKGSVF
ncbi:MAG: class I SAM-dependent methyltransferase [bacterium]